MFLEDDVKEKAEASARRKEKEALLKKLEIAKLKCDEDMGRRSGRLAGQAEDELCQVEGELLVFDQTGENNGVLAFTDYDTLSGGELMRKFDSLNGSETRRVREKKESSKSRTTFECSKLVSSGNTDGTGIAGMLVAEVLELEEMCQSLVPWESAERQGWISKLENAVVGWHSLPSDVDKARAAPFCDKHAKRESIDSAASSSKRRCIDSPGLLPGTGNPASATFHTILTCLKSSIVDLSSRIADISNTEVAIQDLELADDNMSVDESNDDALKKEKLEMQWKKIVHRIRMTPTKRHVQIREMLVDALAAARKAHLSKVVAELRMALLQYHPNAAGDCKCAAVKVLEENGGYDEAYDDDVESVGDVEDEDVVESNIGDVHRDQGGEVDPTFADAVPEAGIGGNESGEHRLQDQPPDVVDTDANDLRITVHEREQEGDRKVQRCRQQRGGQADDDQCTVQGACTLLRCAFAGAPCRQCLYGDGEAKKQTQKNERRKGGQPDRAQRRVSQRADHGRVHQAQQGAGHHPAGDRQADAQQMACTIQCDEHQRGHDR